MEESILCHHGIKGQKWGVRRFQNKDGTRTLAGKTRQLAANNYRYVSKTANDVEEIISTLSDKEKRLLGIKSDGYIKPDQYQYVAKRFVEKYHNVPVAFLDVLYDANNVGVVAIATKNGEQYRHQGYASKLVKRAKKWLNNPKTKDLLGVRVLVWNAFTKNEPSINLAKKHGFKYDKRSSSGEWWQGKINFNDTKTLF